MNIKVVYMDDVAEKIYENKPEIYNCLATVMGLGNIKGFACIGINYLFIVDSEENFQKIKELYPQYYDFIMAELEDFNGYLSNYDGGECYQTIANFQVDIGDCIDSLLDKIEDDYPEVIEILNKCFDNFNKHDKFEDILDNLIKQQVTDVIALKINELNDEIENIKKNGFKWN